MNAGVNTWYVDFSEMLIIEFRYCCVRVLGRKPIQLFHFVKIVKQAISRLKRMNFEVSKDGKYKNLVVIQHLAHKDTCIQIVTVSDLMKVGCLKMSEIQVI